jgi:hypothetical protein
LTDPTRIESPLLVAVFQGRVFNLTGYHQSFPGLCQVSVHTRGLTDLAVLAWQNPATTEHSSYTDHIDSNRLDGNRVDTANGTAHGKTAAVDNNAPRCPLAQHAAELAVRARVPASGGTIWPATPQQPSLAAITTSDPCTLLTGAIADMVSTLHHQLTEEPTDLGRRCAYFIPATKATLLITGSAEQTSRLTAGTTGTAVPLGTQTAHLQPVDGGCTATTALGHGLVTRLEYRHTTSSSDHGDNSIDATCDIALSLLTTTMRQLLSQTSPTPPSPR